MVFWAVVSLAFVAWGLVRLSIDRTPTADAGRSNLETLMPWWVASAMSWTALTAMGWMLWRGLAPARREAQPHAALIVLVVAVAARLVVLMGHAPCLSDDVFRYVLDGRNLAFGFNPYLDTPADRAEFRSTREGGLVERPLGVVQGDAALPPHLEERWPGEADVLSLVNNPELHTISLPAAQWVFALAGLLVREDGSDALTSAWVMRSVMTGFEIVAIVLLLAALSFRGRPAWWAALYAWHPLALSEIAGSGHQDAIGLMLMMLAYIAFTVAPSGTRGRGRVWAWTIALALAALVKPVVLPLAVFMLRDGSLMKRNQGGTEARRENRKQKTESGKQKAETGEPNDSTPPSTISHEPSTSPLRASVPPWFILRACWRNWKAWAASLTIGAAVCAAVAGPLWLSHGGQPLRNVLATSARFTTKWAHFGSVYEPTLWAIRLVDPLEDPVAQWEKKERHEALARLVCVAALLLVCAGAFFFAADAWRAGRIILFAMVLCSTTAHPWYLLWALMLAPLAMSPALWIASLTIPLAYAQFGDVEGWTTPVWAMWLAYAPVYAALAVHAATQVIGNWSGGDRQQRHQAPRARMARSS